MESAKGKTGSYFGLSRWVQCNHKVLIWWRQRQGNLCQRICDNEARLEWFDMMWYEHSTCIPGLKMEEGHEPRKVRTSRSRKILKKQKSKFPPRSFRNECSPANTLIWAQWDPFWTLTSPHPVYKNQRKMDQRPRCKNQNYKTRRRKHESKSSWPWI